MTSPNLKRQEDKKNGFSSAAAAITGALVGAGIAVAGAIVLKDKKNRDVVKRVLDNVKDQAEGYAEKIRKEIKDNKSNVKKIKGGGKK